MTYRELPASEWDRLGPFYERNGDQLPSSERNKVVVAELTPGGDIVGFEGLNLVLHAGPLFVDPKFRGNGIGVRLAREIDCLARDLGARGYISLPSNPASELIMQKVGLTMTDWKLYKREF